ncbi:MAG: GGDEF domain-containing protein [Spirochaetes bacterium]|nr:GGDEF domain-containing protein [Spirochaetota bacterium]
MEERIGFLKNVDILSGLSDAEIGEMLPCFGAREFPGGDVLFREGDVGRELYIVESGEIAVGIKIPGGGEKEIARIRPGDFFGEMSIFDDAPRSATCRTERGAALLSLNRDTFFRLIDEHPGIAVKVMFRMLNITTRRLRNTSRFVADTVRWGEEARRRAITDDLTGIYNRRYLDEALKEQFAAARDRGKPLSLMMVDLDRFREINERHGSAAGDGVILAVVEEFRRQLRGGDILARYGGDEFTVLLPGADMDAALGIAGKIRAGVAALEFQGDSALTMTVSIGVASYPETAHAPEELKAGADRALYAAKEQGRDRVVPAR